MIFIGCLFALARQPAYIRLRKFRLFARAPPACRKGGGTLSRRVRGKGKVKRLRSIAVCAVSGRLTTARVPVGVRPGEKLENSKHSAAGLGKPGFRMRRPTELGRSRV